MFAQDCLSRLFCFDLFLYWWKLIVYNHTVLISFKTFFSRLNLRTGKCTIFMVNRDDLLVTLMMFMFFTFATLSLVLSPLVFLTSFIIKSLILHQVWHTSKIKRTTPLVMILCSLPKLADKRLILLCHWIIMEIFGRFASTPTMAPLEELRLWTFKFTLPLSFNFSFKLTVISRLAKSFDMHLIHGAISFEGLSWTALIHLLLFWCLFTATTDDMTSMSFHCWLLFTVSRGASWSVRFCWLRSSGLLIRVQKHRLLCPELILFGLSMFLPFYTTSNSTSRRAYTRREHWNFSSWNVPCFKWSSSTC